MMAEFHLATSVSESWNFVGWLSHCNVLLGHLNDRTINDDINNNFAFLTMMFLKKWSVENNSAHLFKNWA